MEWRINKNIFTYKCSFFFFVLFFQLTYKPRTRSRFLKFQLSTTIVTCNVTIREFLQTTMAKATRTSFHRQVLQAEKQLYTCVIFVYLCSCAEQQREMIKFCEFWWTRTTTAKLSYFVLEWSNRCLYIFCWNIEYIQINCYKSQVKPSKINLIFNSSLS